MGEHLNVSLGNVIVSDSGTTDFEELENRPKYNGTVMTGDTNIPLGKTALSELTDDETHRVVTDTEKSTWNAKANTSDIPTALSQLAEDATHRLVTDTEKSTWNAKASTDDIPTTLAELASDESHRLVTDTQKAAWNAKANVSDIPTKTSELINDSGFITEHQSLSAYRTSAAQDVIDTALSDSISEKYTKPATGVPKTDLATDVQTSLGKADSAYQKPATGIPDTDLEEDYLTDIPQATGSALGGIKADAKTATDTQEVKIDNTTGKLYTAPGEEPKAFVAIYGTTTAAEVAAALTAGKAVICDYVQNDIHCQMLLETESNSKYTFTEAGVATNSGITTVYGYGAALNKNTNEWEVISGNGTIPSTAEQITYDSTLASHESGSVGAQIASQSSQIVTLEDSLTNKAASSSDVGKFAKVKTVTDGKVSEWEYGSSSGGGGDTAGVVAPAYSASSTYAKGALVIYDQKLYEANQEISTAEAWTAAHWTETTVSGVLSEEYQRYGHITVSCVDSSSVQITGVTITVKSQVDGTTFGTYPYNGSPITVKTPYGYSYKILASYKSGYVTPAPIFGTGTSTATATFVYKTGMVYGFHISDSEGDPSSKVTYISGTDAYGMTPCHMDFTNDVFDYGSWENAFFMPRPCMLKYDGTVDYYLDPDDYSKKSDGVTASEVADTSYGGNAMMEWGQNGQKIWYKVVPDDNDNYSASIYIANEQADSDYKDWSFIDSKNNQIDHFYTPIYNGSNISSKLRSISAQSVWNTTGGASNEINNARNNNTGTDVEWYTEVEADIQLINFLLILMAKSTQMQGVYGYGHYTGGSSASSLLTTGTMNTKGMFWGTDQTGYGVKVFGMENWWGNQHRHYAGHMNISNTQKFKMTCGTADGSEASEYNLDGTGYISIGETITGTSGGYITKMKFLAGYGMFPVKVSSTASTDYCDGAWFSSGTMYACRGGYCGASLGVGAFAVYLYDPASASHWSLGAAPSCKPLASVG